MREHSTWMRRWSEPALDDVRECKQEAVACVGASCIHTASSVDEMVGALLLGTRSLPRHRYVNGWLQSVKLHEGTLD
jgi:hypothetical protein